MTKRAILITLLGIATCLALGATARAETAEESLQHVAALRANLVIEAPRTHGDLTVYPLTVSGANLWEFRFLSISHEGVSLASLILLKAVAIVILIFPMFGTAPFHTSMKALQHLRLPDRFVQIILFTYRYIFIFFEEIRRMNNAAKTRGFETRTRWHTFRTLGNFIGILLVRSFERTERLHNAMISRGYTGRMVTLSNFQLTRWDSAKGVMVTAICVLLFVGDRFL